MMLRGNMKGGVLLMLLLVCLVGVKGDFDDDDDCRGGSRATFNLFEQFDSNRRTIMRSNSSCDAERCLGDIETSIGNVYTSSDKHFRVGSVDSVCAVLEDTDYAQCDFNFRVDDLSPNSNRDTYTASGIIGIDEETQISIGGGTGGLWTGMMGSVYVEPRESSRTFRFSFCLASQKCNGGSLVFEQIEGFEYLIPGEEPSDDSDKPTEGAVRLFNDVLFSENFPGAVVGVNDGRCTLLPDEDRWFCMWNCLVKSESDKLFMQGSIYNKEERTTYVSVTSGSGVWFSAEGSGRTVVNDLSPWNETFDLEMFYGCQDELAVIVVEGQNPTLSRFGDFDEITMWSDFDVEAAVASNSSYSFKFSDPSVYGFCTAVPDSVRNFCSWTIILDGVNNTLSVVGSVEFGFNGDTEPTTPFGVGVSGGTGDYAGARGAGFYYDGIWELEFAITSDLPEFASASSLSFSVLLMVMWVAWVGWMF